MSARNHRKPVVFRQSGDDFERESNGLSWPCYNSTDQATFLKSLGQVTPCHLPFVVTATFGGGSPRSSLTWRMEIYKILMGKGSSIRSLWPGLGEINVCWMFQQPQYDRFVLVKGGCLPRVSTSSFLTIPCTVHHSGLKNACGRAPGERSQRCSFHLPMQCITPWRSKTARNALSCLASPGYSSEFNLQQISIESRNP